jgi:hypothetical protein
MNSPVQQVQQALVANSSFGYFSTIRCQFERTGAGPYVWTLQPVDRKAFQYRAGGDATVAGFAAGYVATYADTSIQDPGRTLLQQDVEIGGLCCRITPDSDPFLASLVERNSWLVLATDGQEGRVIGKITDFPGAGGFKGAGQTAHRYPQDSTAGLGSGGEGAKVHFFQNGEPAAGDYKRWHKNPISWYAPNKNQKDNNLAVTLKLNGAIAFSYTDRPFVALGAAAAQQEAALAPAATPGAPGSYVDIVVSLVTRAKGPIGANW